MLTAAPTAYWEEISRLRGYLELTDYKRLVLSLIYLKHLSIETGGISQAGSTLQRMLSNSEEYQAANCAEKIDQTLEILRKLNPAFGKLLDRDFAKISRSAGGLAALIGLIDNYVSDFPGDPRVALADLLSGCLKEFAREEGRFDNFTPSTISSLLIGIANPERGVVYDPCCGTGSMLIGAHTHAKSRNGSAQLFGQESNPLRWQHCNMNLSVHGIAADIGHDPASTLCHDLHPDLRADFIIANPPFNQENWQENWPDSQNGNGWKTPWQFGSPPESNGNFAWIQCIISHLAPDGIAAFTMSSGALTSNACGENEIRQAIVQADLVSAVIALPKDAFQSTRIAAAVWVLSGQKKHRQGQTLFLDAPDLNESSIARVIDTLNAWRGLHTETYADIPGYCRSARTEEIAVNDFQLAGGRYIGGPAKKSSADGIDARISRLVSRLKNEMIESAVLDQQLKDQLNRIGYEI